MNKHPPFLTAQILIASWAINGQGIAQGNEGAFRFTRQLAANDVVDFSAGAGGDGIGGDSTELNITWVSSIQPLKNGNLLVGNFLRNQEGNGAHAFEVTRDKKVVWKWDDHSLIKSLTTVRALEE